MTQLGTHFQRQRIRRRTYRHVQYIQPIAYRDARRRIQRIVTDLVDSQVPGTHHMAMQGPFGVSVSNGGEIRYHPTWEANVGFQIGDPVYRLAGQPTHFDLGTPQRSGNRLRWDTQHLLMDFYYAGHTGKLALLFKTPAYQNIDNRQLAFPISYAGCERQDAHIVIDGQPVMRLRGFHAYDYDDQQLSAPVQHEWHTIAGQEYIVVTLPLAMDGWTKPVLDPTFQVRPLGSAGKETYIWANAPTTNYGGQAAMYLGNNPVSKDWHVLIKFDLSTIPDNAIILSTTLSLYNHHLTGGVSTAYVRPCKRNWSEYQATWNVYSTGNSWATAGGTGEDDRGPVIGSFTFPPSSTWIHTSLAGTTKSNLDYGYGWIIDAPDGSYDNLALRTAEYSSWNPNVVPYLTIEYQLPVPVGPAFHRRMRH